MNPFPSRSAWLVAGVLAATVVRRRVSPATVVVVRLRQDKVRAMESTQDQSIPVAVSSATTKQLLIAVLGRLDNIDARLEQVETRMSNLTENVQALKGAVDGVAQRLLPQIQTLKDALAAAQADDDVAAGVLADSIAAADALGVEVDRLNALGTDPSTPVDPDAPNEGDVPDVEVPADGGDGGDNGGDNAPVEDAPVDPEAPAQQG